MSIILAVANRKGGVGKSTIATMLAHAFSVWGEMRVLLIDVDSQANASLILLGGEHWVRAREANKTVSDYIYNYFLPQYAIIRQAAQIDASNYIIEEVADLIRGDGSQPPLNLMTGSLDIDDREHEILISLSKQLKNIGMIEKAVVGRIKTLLEATAQGYDLVIIDCPPGISFSTRAALLAADRVIVPFRPDYVSLFAVDRISKMIENISAPKKLADVPMSKRRYVTLANMCQSNALHERIIQEVAAFHPILQCRVPAVAAIANAFDWQNARKPIRQKYGSAISHVEALYRTVLPLVAHGSGVEITTE